MNDYKKFRVGNWVKAPSHSSDGKLIQKILQITGNSVVTESIVCNLDELEGIKSIKEVIHNTIVNIFKLEPYISAEMHEPSFYTFSTDDNYYTFYPKDGFLEFRDGASIYEIQFIHEFQNLLIDLSKKEYYFKWFESPIPQ